MQTNNRSEVENLRLLVTFKAFLWKEENKILIGVHWVEGESKRLYTIAISQSFIKGAAPLSMIWNKRFILNSALCTCGKS